MLSMSSPVQRIISLTSVLVKFGFNFQTKDASHDTKGVAIDVQDILTYLSVLSE
jgi:hypothetical protein